MAEGELSPQRRELLKRRLAARRAAEARTLSFAQERFWFLEELAPGTAEAHITIATRARGRLRLDALRAALRAIADAHPSLRTRFPAEDGNPTAEVLPAISPSLEVLPPRATPGLADLARDVHVRPFDLAAAPPWRVVCAPLGADSNAEHALVFTFHHILADGWSMGLLARDLAQAYNAALAGQSANLHAPPTTYQALATLERKELTGERLTGLVEGWRARLAGAPRETNLPLDRPRPPIADPGGRTQRFHLDKHTSTALLTLAKRAQTTPYQALLGLVAAFLGRTCQQDDLVLGTSYAGRDRLGSTEVFGAFVNTLPVRLAMAGDATLSGVLAAASAGLRDALDGARLPFEKLVSELDPERDPGRTPLFNVFFELVVAHDIPGWRELEVEEVPVDLGTTAFDLTIAFDPRGSRFPIVLQYRTALFDDATIARLGERFVRFVAAWLAAPETELDDVEWLDKGELHALAAHGAGPEVPPGQSHLERVRAHAQGSPKAPAVVDGERTLTYGELVRAADALAERLECALAEQAGAAVGASPDGALGVRSAVVVELPRSAEAVVAMLAAHIAGATYVPLDVDAPATRRAQLLAALKGVPQVHLSAHPSNPQAAPTISVELDALLAAPGREGADPERTNPDPESAAHLFFTSGSTGKPKGVVVPHRALDNHGAWLLATFAFGPADRVLLRTPLAFDASLWELWAGLLGGGTLVVARDADAVDGAAVLALCAAERVTVLQTVPALLHGWCEEAAWGALPDLRLVVAGGEALALELAHRALERLGPGTELYNLYGPTEACVDAAGFGGSRASFDALSGTAVPIGRPLANTALRVAERSGRPAPLGHAGELWLAGAQLAHGYWRDPEGTAQAFVEDSAAIRWYRTGDRARLRPDGLFEHLGRADGQVQVRGARVELAEIERALRGCPGVRDAAVVTVDEAGTTRLVGFIVLEASPASAGAEATPKAGGPGAMDARVRAVRDALASSLPRYMLPTPLVALDALPLGTTEKVDRRALAERAARLEVDVRGRAPEGPVETFLVASLARELGRESVPVDVDFFALGGHSLMAARLVAAARKQFDVEIALRTFYDTPTLEALARAVMGAEQALCIPRRNPSAPVPLSRAQERLWVACAGSSPALYNMPGALLLRGALDHDALSAALDRLVARHEVLRARFPVGPQGRPVQVFDAQLPRLAVERMESVGAGFEEDLRARVAHEAQHAFDLARGPLARWSLVQYAPELHALVLNVHHLISDGWSVDVFLRELAAAYAGKGLSDLAVGYGDFAVWERGHAIATEAVDAWCDRLEGAAALRAPLALPRLAPRHPAGAGKSTDTTASEVALTVPSELVARAQALAESAGLSAHNVWLASFAAFVARVSHAEDLLIGAVLAGRPLPELQDLVGFFVSALPLRLELGEAATFDALLAHTRARMGELQTSAERPDAPGFDHLVEALEARGMLQRDPGDLPLFQVGFDYVADEAAPPALGSVRCETLDVHAAAAKLDWNVRIEARKGGLDVRFEYRTGMFEADQVEALVRGWLTLARGLFQTPDAAWRRLPLLDAGARLALFDAGVGPAGPVDADASVPAALERLAAKSPDRTALSMTVPHGEVQVSFGELWLAAGRLADGLIGALALDAGHQPLRIAIAMPRSPLQVALLIATWRAGGAWLVVDPALEASRATLATADVHALLTLEDKGRPLLHEALGFEHAPVFLAPSESGAGSAPRASAADAYLIATSGTTGEPKVIAVPHHALANQVAAARAVYGFGPRDVVPHRIPLTFDAALLELMSPLAAGAEVRLVSADVGRDPEPFAAEAAAAGATCLLGVSSWLEALVATPAWPPPHLRLVITGGEAPRPPLVDALTALPKVRAINSYGPAEACIEATAHELRPSDALRPPIGRALPGCEAHVLDANGEPALPGVLGEIVVAGAGLGRYLPGADGEPLPDAARFRPHPRGIEEARAYWTGDRAYRLPTGELIFAGRVDRELKLGGRRVDIDGLERAIERAVARVAGVGLVALSLTTGEHPILIAHVEHAGASAAGAALAGLHAELEAAVRGAVPRGLRPAHWQVHATLPRFSSGKIDYRALTDGQLGRRLQRALIAPKTPREARALELFAAHLGDAEVGMATSFFDAGGHSLSALGLLAELRTAPELGPRAADLTLTDLFQHATPAALSEWLDAPLNAKAELEAIHARMRTDAELPADWSLAAASGGQATLLTGATGFLGAFLLARLQSAGEVTCLVRAADDAAALARVAANLARFGLELAPHVRAVAGDLAAPRFGLDPERWEELVQASGQVLHNGAAVDFFRGYDALRGANVLGTRTALELAFASGARLLLVSTIGVPAMAGAGATQCADNTSSPSTPIDERTPIAALNEQQEGYEQSKWVSEALAADAASRGLDVRIVRPGRVAASRVVSPGAAAVDDFAHRFWLGCLELGIAPDLESAFDLVPVDDVARATCTALAAEDPPSVLHLLHPKRTPFAVLLGAAERAGHQLTRCAPDEWIQLVRAQLSSLPGGASPAAPLAPALERLAPVVALLEADASTGQGAGLSPGTPLDADAALDRVDSRASQAWLAANEALPGPLDAAYFDALIARLDRELGRASSCES